MKDRLGRTIQVGDRLVYVWHRRTAVVLDLVEVVGFSPKGVRVEYPNGDCQIVFSTHNTVVVPKAAGEQ